MIEEATADIYWAKIYIAGDYWKALDACRRHCSEVGLCVTVTQTEYVYSFGAQSGVIVGLINYPRYPETAWILEEIAEELGEKLLKELSQSSFTIMSPGSARLFKIGQ